MCLLVLCSKELGIVPGHGKLNCNWFGVPLEFTRAVALFSTLWNAPRTTRAVARVWETVW